MSSSIVSRMFRPVTVISAPSENGRGMWRFKTSDDERYATKDCLLASLAQRYFDTKTPVIVDSYYGFYYREVWAITPVEQA